jgi:maltokinase
VDEEGALRAPPLVEEGALRLSRNHLLLDATHAVRVVATEDGHRAEPVTLADGSWRRSVAGDGAGLALLHRLRNRSAVEDGFRVTAYARSDADDESERAMGVDQTHDSWVVGGRVVVKWMTEPLVGPHPAADRLRRLAEVGFAESPALVGVVEWRDPESGHWVPVVIAQAYLPGTEDGWTWGLDAARRALRLVPGDASAAFGADLGEVVGRLHLALADDPVTRMTPELARRYADDALASLDLALRLLEPRHAESFALLSAHRPEVEAALAGLADTAGSPVLSVHGDLHVGQVLRDETGRYAVVDFDGNPTVPPDLRAAPAPAARDVAEILASLENVEHVVRHYAPELTDEDGLAWSTGEQAAFLDGYRRALGDHDDLFDEALLPAYDWEQVCREIVYAGQREFLEWLYVPAAELRRRLVPGE